MGSASSKGRLYDGFAAVGKALSSGRRLELLDVLAQGPRSVELVLDVRPAAEFLAGHVPGAVSVPPDDLSARVRRLPHKGDIVAYCRGPFCVYADDAVRALRERGRQAARLVDGFPEWRRAGLPVAVGDETAAAAG